MKTGICIAMPEEAEMLLKLFRIDREEPDNLYGNAYFYDAGNTVIAIGGVGVLAAAMATQTLITVYGCDSIINAGCCGCTGNKYHIGDIYSVNKIYKGDVDMTLIGYDKFQISGHPAYLEPEVDPDYPTAVCRSSDRFIVSGSGISPQTLTEMEGFSVAYVCYEYNIPCRIYKVISDMCDRNVDSSEYQENVVDTCNELGKHLYNILSRHSE